VYLPRWRRVTLVPRRVVEARRLRDEAEARAALSALAASGQPLPEWARSRGQLPRSLNAWRQNLSRRDASPGAAPAPLRLVELEAPPRRAPVYAVVLGDARVEVGDDFDAGTLRRLLGAVRGC
jgi:hypothetical protein